MSTLVKDLEILVGQDRETKLYHGLVYRNRPTPSGCDRWLLQLSDNRGFKTEKEAKEKFEELETIQELRKSNRVI